MAHRPGLTTRGRGLTLFGSTPSSSSRWQGRDWRVTSRASNPESRRLGAASPAATGPRLSSGCYRAIPRSIRLQCYFTGGLAPIMAVPTARCRPELETFRWAVPSVDGRSRVSQTGDQLGLFVARLPSETEKPPLIRSEALYLHRTQ